MFIRPHHFQAVQRYWSQQGSLGDKWDLHYNWGLRAIELDREALGNYRLVIRSLKARLRDGTLVAVPEDGNLPDVDLKPAFEQAGEVTAYLAVPVLNLGRANVAANGRSEGGRYLLDTQELEDENTGVNPQPIQVRLLNLQLLLSTDSRAGYEVLPIARLARSARAEAVPQLDPGYIPPLLAFDAWEPLQADILQTIYHRLGRKIEEKANQAVSRGISFGTHSQGDFLILARLREYNEAYALLGILAFAEGVHPLPAYLELCRLVGQLAIFGDARRPPELPKYDHDDLGGCFLRVKAYLDQQLDEDKGPEYEERPFIGAGQRMQVAMERKWLESDQQLYVGVQSELAPEECVRLLTKQGGLNMKIGSSQNVDDIFRRGQLGLKFNHSPHPPRALPSALGLIYFQVNRDSQLEEWQNVQQSLTLAIRLNVPGNIEGERVLTIRTGAQATTLRFTLYVVPQEK
jgi:type VI secretion system protein ImpJ